MIVLTERELELLAGEPSDVWKMYVCLRWRMDFDTGLVGAESGVSWWALREDMSISASQGRRREEAGAPSEKFVRNKADRLVTLGLLESRSLYRKLVFFMPMAHRERARLKKVGQSWGRQAGQSYSSTESLEQQGFDGNYPQQVGQTQNAEVGHTSGIRVNPISVDKQQHTDCPVDNSAALRFNEIANWLKAEEKRRGKIVAVAAGDKHVKGWISKEVAADELRDAHALAVADRERQNNSAPIHVGFLDLFIGRVISQRKAWFSGWSGIVAKGLEYGLTHSPDEPHHVFRSRVFAAAGMSEEEARR